MRGEGKKSGEKSLEMNEDRWKKERGLYRMLYVMTIVEVQVQ